MGKSGSPKAWLCIVWALLFCMLTVDAAFAQKDIREQIREAERKWILESFEAQAFVDTIPPNPYTAALGVPHLRMNVALGSMKYAYVAGLLAGAGVFAVVHLAARDDATKAKYSDDFMSKRELSWLAGGAGFAVGSTVAGSIGANQAAWEHSRLPHSDYSKAGRPALVSMAAYQFLSYGIARASNGEVMAGMSMLGPVLGGVFGSSYFVRHLDRKEAEWFELNGVRPPSDRVNLSLGDGISSEVPHGENPYAWVLADPGYESEIWTWSLVTTFVAVNLAGTLGYLNNREDAGSIFNAKNDNAMFFNVSALPVMVLVSPLAVQAVIDRVTPEEANVSSGVGGAVMGAALGFHLVGSLATSGMGTVAMAFVGTNLANAAAVHLGVRRHMRYMRRAGNQWTPSTPEASAWLPEIGVEVEPVSFFMVRENAADHLEPSGGEMFVTRFQPVLKLEWRF